METQDAIIPDFNKRNIKSKTRSSTKNAQPAKRKLSTNNFEEKQPIKPNKKRKTEKAYPDVEPSGSAQKSKEKTVDKVRMSDEKEICKTSIRPVPKGGKNKKQTSKTGIALESAMENRGDKSSSWESSDDQIPLSEISKRSKTKQVIESKGKSGSLSMRKGKLIEGKVKILKNLIDTGSPFKNTASKSSLKESKAHSPLKMKGKSIEAKIDKSLYFDVDQTSNCNTKTKTKPPVKRKSKALSKGVKDSEVAKENHLVKGEGCTPVKTQSGEDKVGRVRRKDETKGNLSVKETTVERKASKAKVQDFEDSDKDGDESEMDWEDVAEMSGILDDVLEASENNVASASSNVEVTIKVPGQKSKRGRPSQEEMRTWIRRKINRYKKESQLSAHKVHLLALLAIGLKKSEMCNNSLVQAIGLSLLPEVFTQRGVLKAWDIPFLTRVTTWLKNKAPNPGDIHTGNSEATYLMRVLEKKVYLLIAILRALGLRVRLVMSLQVLSHKVTDGNESKKTVVKQTKTPAKRKQTPKPAATAKQPAKKTPKQTAKGTLLTKLKSSSTPAKTVSPLSSRGLREKSKVDYTPETKSEYFNEENTSNVEFSDDDDFECSLMSPKRGRTSSSGGSRLSGEFLQDAPADGETSGVIKKGRDIWIEVYLEKEKKWICIDGDVCSVNQPEECERLATKPIKYAMAFDNDCSVKDVTCRYAIGWLTTTPKLRVDPDWLTETLDFYRTKNLKRDKKEDSQLKARLLQKPLPQTVSEFKNHPLYVLERHLLKFQAIYPESAATLGFCRSEAVYSRDCVHTLHTRELWMKEARVVKAGEQAYKIVKGRKTKRRMLENVGELKAELFGRWQTEDYIPPPVVDGKVPRNEYGNVELFKPSMLPAGACHIQIPGIHRLARKLNIDAAAAIVGFDFHGGFNHPIIDGVVVGEEFKEQLLLAWDKEQQEKMQREEAKREKRVLDHWTHLVRSLRIRERLKRKYKMEEEDVPKSKIEGNSPKETENVTDISLSWPLNKQEGKTARDDEGHCHVFLPTNHAKDAITGEWSKSCACGFKEPLEKL